MLSLIEKIFDVARDIIYKILARREELRKSFDLSFKKSSEDSNQSADMHELYDEIKGESLWKNKE